MKTWTLLPICLFLLFLRTSAAPIETLPKSEVIKVDRAELRFVVKLPKSEETRILQITADTRFFKEGKYAISEDLGVGDLVNGRIHKRADGVYEAVRIYIVKKPLPAVALLE